MLRVEASNLPTPRSAPRPRRLLPNPASVKRRAVNASRHEQLPPPSSAAPAAPSSAPTAAAAPTSSHRWSVRLELKDDDIAKLYGQGMTRGAVVWKKGMVEWRPLLVTPELTSLLRRTRTTLTEVTSSPLAAEELTLPRPARLPSDLPVQAAMAPAPSTQDATSSYPDNYPEKPRFTTVAPTAMEIEREPTSPRRRVELVAVAVAAFALAWLTHDRLSSPGSGDVSSAAALAAATPAAPACEPATPKPVVGSTSVLTPTSSIPTVALSDLPLAGSRASRGAAASGVTTGARSSTGRSAPTRSASAAAPTRAELMGALGQVSQAASGCGERNGPVRVVMSFGGSGVARSIQVSGAGLPAQTRSCIIGAASRARVPPFSGDPVTVSKTL